MYIRKLTPVQYMSASLFSKFDGLVYNNMLLSYRLLIQNKRGMGLSAATRSSSNSAS